MSDRDAREEKKTNNASAAATATIDSFSQLPFIRPPAREKPPPPSSRTPPGIVRLFGFDVPPDAAATSTAASPATTIGVKEAAKVVEESMDPTPAAAAVATSTSADATTVETAAAASGDSRKFECHYCCRHFPTSQALGGHQNAHKRERQHAKRAQFQSAMALHHHGQYFPLPADPAAHLYAATTAFAAAYRHNHRFSAAPPPPPPPHYPSWAGAARYYTGPGSISQPITGSPVAAPSRLWRVPSSSGVVSVGTPPFAAQRQERPAPPDLPMLGGDEHGVVTGGAGSRSFSPSTSSSSSSASPHKRSAPPEQKENVSLDLSL